MKKYEQFLEKVKDAHPDEFSELQDILSRHKQLQGKNEELHSTQKCYITELDIKSKELAHYIKEKETQKITINNEMSHQQQALEVIDNEKSTLLNQRDEKNKEKSQKTTAIGKILMTIDNLYTKCNQKRPDMITSTKDYKKHDKIKYFNSTEDAA